MTTVIRAVCVLGVCENPRKEMQTHDDLHEVPLLRGVKDEVIFATKPQHLQGWECTPVWEHSSVMRLSQVRQTNCSVGKCRAVSLEMVSP